MCECLKEEIEQRREQKEKRGRKNKVGSFHTKINSKCVKEENIRSKTLKILEENKGEKCHDNIFGNNI